MKRKNVMTSFNNRLPRAPLTLRERAALCLISLAIWSLPGCTGPAPRQAGAQSDRKDIAVLRFVVEPTFVDDFRAPDDVASFMREKLAEEGTIGAEEIVTAYPETGLRASSLSLFGFKPRDLRIPGNMLLDGTIRIPLALPDAVKGVAASHRDGIIAAAHVVLRNPDGSVYEESDAAVLWGDLSWIGSKPWHVRPISVVLREAARDAAGLATERLFERLEERHS